MVQEIQPVPDTYEYDVFLSFASADETLARPVWEHLSASSLRVFWSDATLKDRLGEPWFEVIQKALGNSRHCVVICTPAAMSSKWVRAEYSAFYDRCYRAPERRLIPLLAGDFQPAQLPPFLGVLGASRLDGAPSLRTLAMLLGGTDLEALRADLAEREEENHALRTAVKQLTAQIGSTSSPTPDSGSGGRAPVAPPGGSGPATGGGVTKRCREVVRFWIDQMQVHQGPDVRGEMGETITDTNSREIFQILQWALPEECSHGVESLLRELFQDFDQIVRWKAMRLLVYYHVQDPRTIRTFWQRELTNGCIRELVFEALEHLPATAGLELSAEIARHDSVGQIRMAAVKRLSSYGGNDGDGEIVKALMDAVGDRDEGVQAEALQGLRQMGAREGVEPASRLALRSTDTRVRGAALKLLAALAPVDSFLLTVRSFATGSLGLADFRECVGLYEARFGGPPLLQIAGEYKTVTGEPVAAVVQTCIDDASAFGESWPS